MLDPRPAHVIPPPVLSDPGRHLIDAFLRDSWAGKT